MTRTRNERLAYCYTRVSTTEQAEGMSVDAQFRALRARAAERQISIAGEFADRGVTGTDDQRPEFRKMIEAVLAPSSEVGIILVVHTSRFMRDVELARRYKRELRKHGVRVVSIQQETTDDPNGELMEGVYELFDQHESRIIGMRTRAAMTENARQGFVNGAAPPYGFRVETIAVQGKKKGRLVIDQDEAVVVRQIFERYLAGRGAMNIAHELSAAGSSHRAKPWSRELVLRTLAEPAVVGEYRWGKKETRTGRRRAESEFVKASVPAIVSREIFEAGEQARRQRDPVKGDGRHRRTTQLLGGFLTCVCGKSCQLETAGKRSPSGDFYRYYQCRAFRRVGKRACPGFRVQTKVMDQAVLDHLVEALNGERIREALVAYTTEQEQARSAASEERSKLEAELADLDRKIGRWLEAFELGGDLAELGSDRLAQLRGERAETARRLAELTSLQQPPPFLYKPSAARALQERLRAAFASHDRHLVRGLLEALVEHLVVDRGEVVVHYNLDGLVALLAEKSRGVGVETTAAKVRTDVYRWRARRDSNP